MLRCERCGETVDNRSVDCPHRATGKCPYELHRASIQPRAGWVLVAFGALFVWPCFALGRMVFTIRFQALRQTENWLFLLLFGLVLCMTLLLLVPGLYWALGRRVTLSHQKSSAMWQRSCWLGIPIEQTVVSNMEPLSLLLDLSWSPRFPASVAALSVVDPPSYRQRWGRRPYPHAVYLFQATLLSLLARRAIAIRRATTHKSWLGLWHRHVDEYLFVPGDSMRRQTVVGAVERRIVDVLTHRSIQPDTGRWPGGATTYELIRAVYGTDQHSARTWPLNLAWSDAAGRGIGHLTNRLGGLEAQYGYSLDDSPGIVQEGEVVRGWLDELAYTRPDLMDRLDAEITRAIRSRQLRTRPH
jgi:hypothetical protein